MKKRRWTQEEKKQWIKHNNKLFYCNKEDTAIFIRKRHGIAWTLNWGNPWSYVIIMAMVVILIFVNFSKLTLLILE